MASAFSFNDVTIFFSEKMLFNHTTLTISDGDRIGVVGKNGSGKSTFLRLLAGLEKPDEGSISVQRNMSIAYLPQTPVLRQDATITEAALQYLPARPGEDAASAAYEAQTILTQLGFTDLNQPVSQLSGGQKMRVALAGVLCRDSDVLLLDEPTNHIDLEMAQWLEDRLLNWRKTLIVVTHDRYLLERAFSRIFNVGGGEVGVYNCPYSGYLEERAQREEMQAATLRKNKSLYRKELAWIRRGAPARSTKAKGRIQRFDAVAEAIKEAPPEAELTMKSVASRLGRKIVSWEHLDAAIGGNTLIRNFSYTLLRDDRLGIVGGNVLILDEPTNDLDLDTLNILEDYLDSFQGAIIAVSHDRYFLDRITTHLFAVEEGKMVPYISGYQSYLDAQEEKQEAASPVKEEPKPAEPQRRQHSAVKFSYKEQRDFETIEDTVLQLEEKVESLAAEIEANAADYVKVAVLMAEQEETQRKLDEATERWLYLQEKWEQIQAATNK